MECNKDEAARAKEIAEKKFAARDLQGAKKFALKAQALFPGLEGIAQMVATMDFYLASEVEVDGEKDWYSILSVAMTADDETLKKQYKKLILQFHPDKNKSVGADGPGTNSFTVPGGKISFSTDAGAYQFQGFNGGPSWKPGPPVRTNLSKTFSPSDLKSMLLEKMKNELKNKLKELENGTSQVAAHGKANKKEVVMENDGEDEIHASDDPNTSKDVHVDPQENDSGDSTDTENENDPLTYNVPDPDFHDFDKDRNEESFKSDQIWATYDDDDGMPRYYALIREVLSFKPFKIRMSFLTSRRNDEFGPLNWASAGFTKTCGDFRIGKCENNDILNMFSHQIKWEKGQRGVIKIYPQKGDIWALYRNWSPDWDDDTPDNVRHAYDVFECHQDQNTAKKIPKEEMFRFSHQVPFYRMSGEEAPDVPKDSYELDPAAISKELLQVITETVEAANGTCEC
ncbi:hypothetical protein QOZ80_1AG0039170 [Eleusine coracana subsp. coracana]|nr:hypothetical protein QOZ80_1AG0039170 [Eleusine coracana subsp. coracana]